MAVALEYAASREDAEDIVQDTFRRVLENLDRFNVERRSQPWFFTILRNTARNAAKSRRVRGHETLTPQHASEIPGPFEETHRRQLRERILAAIGELPKMQRTCFTLCVVEGLTSIEAASAVGVAESTVRVHVFKARQTLQGLLELWRDYGEEA